MPTVEELQALLDKEKLEKEKLAKNNATLLEEKMKEKEKFQNLNNQIEEEKKSKELELQKAQEKELIKEFGLEGAEKINKYLDKGFTLDEIKEDFIDSIKPEHSVNIIKKDNPAKKETGKEEKEIKKIMIIDGKRVEIK